MGCASSRLDAVNKGPSHGTAATQEGSNNAPAAPLKAQQQRLERRDSAHSPTAGAGAAAAAAALPQPAAAAPQPLLQAQQRQQQGSVAAQLDPLQQQQQQQRSLADAQPLTQRGDTAMTQEPEPLLLGPGGGRVTLPSDPPGRRYLGAPQPCNEEARNDTLCSLQILDTQNEQRFDDVTNLVCSIFQAPIAIVSLVDKERQWFKSVVGLAVDQTARTHSFCAWTLLPEHPEVLVVPDATQDVRFQNNPLVLRDPNIRFYAGAPLVTSSGHRLGSLCVIDRKPRQFDAESCNLLCNFAEVVVREIEKEKLRAHESMRLSRQTSGLMRAIDCFSQGIMLVDTSVEGWSILFANDAWMAMTGIDRSATLHGRLWKLFSPVGAMAKDDAIREVQQQAEATSTFEVTLEARAADESLSFFTAQFKPAGNGQLDEEGPLIGIPGFVDWAAKLAGSYYFAVVKPCAGVPTADGLVTAKAESTDPFDDVQLGPLLGQGAFGKVYRGLWNGAAVAVKVIQHSQQVSASGQAELAPGPPVPAGELQRDVGSLAPSTKGRAGELEAMLSADLSHPNIVQTYKTAVRPMASRDVQAARHFIESWIVLEYCDRGSLQDAVDKGAFFVPKESGSDDVSQMPSMKAIRNTAREIAAALMYLHSRDVLHGDLTGGNILLTSSDGDERCFSAKVADFGLSRVLGAEAVNTGTYGTVTHMPPELLTTGQLGKPADVYAFGVLLWEMYMGQRPWAGLMQMQIIFHVTIQKKRLQFPEGTPQLFKELALACMDSQAEARPTFGQVLTMLEDLPC